MKEVIGKLERILELTEGYGICINGTGRFATEESQLEYTESKIRLNAIQALDLFDKNNIDRQSSKIRNDYVKVEDTIWALESEFRSGDLYRIYAHQGEEPMYGVIESEFALIQAMERVNVYRKVETKIEVRDEFIEFVESKCAELSVDGEWSFACIAAELFDSGRVKFVNEGDK